MKRHSIALLALLNFGFPAFGAEPPKLVGTEVVIERARLLELQDGDLRVMCSLGCVVSWTTEASSEKAPEGERRHDVAQIEDGIVRTAWIGSSQRQGIGDSIVFRFSKEDFAEVKTMTTTCRGFRIVNGYGSTEKEWNENSRVKRFRVFRNDSPVVEILLKDTMAVQECEFDSIEISPGDQIRLEILEVFPGGSFPQAAISELIPMGGH